MWPRMCMYESFLGINHAWHANSCPPEKITVGESISGCLGRERAHVFRTQHSPLKTWLRLSAQDGRCMYGDALEDNTEGTTAVNAQMWRQHWYLQRFTHIIYIQSMLSGCCFFYIRMKLRDDLWGQTCPGESFPLWWCGAGWHWTHINQCSRFPCSWAKTSTLIIFHFKRMGTDGGEPGCLSMNYSHWSCLSLAKRDREQPVLNIPTEVNGYWLTSQYL